MFILLGVEIDLTKEDFIPGNSTYDRVIWCFKDRVPAVELLFCFYKDGVCQKIEFPSETTDVRCFSLNEKFRDFPNIPAPFLVEKDNENYPIFQSTGSINAVSSHNESEAITLEFLIWNGLVSSEITR